MEKKVMKSCIFLTRRCNLNCPYCQIKHRDVPEIGTEAWYAVFEALAKNKDVLFHVLFGGEPMLRKDLCLLVRRMSELNMKFTLITNATMANAVVLHQLKDAGLKSISSSVDAFLPTSQSTAASPKNSAGIGMLLEARRQGYEDVVANVTMTIENVDTIADLIKFFTREGIWVIMELHHFATTDHPWEFRKKREPWTQQEKEKLIKCYAMLKKMKQDGALIQNEEIYFDSIEKHIDLNWYCGFPSCFTIDCDGTLMACVDAKGEESSKIKAVDGIANPDIYIKAAQKDIEKCPGCFYNHTFMNDVYYNMPESYAREMLTHEKGC